MDTQHEVTNNRTAFEKIASLFTLEGLKFFRQCFREGWEETAAAEAARPVAVPYSAEDDDDEADSKKTFTGSYLDPLDPYGAVMEPWTDEYY